MITFCNWFVKITGWLPAKICFKTQIRYEDRRRQGRRLRGPVILVSNHTSIWDYAVWMFVFFGQTLRVQMAEVLFEKFPLCLLLKGLGGIRVDRTRFDYSAVARSEAILRKGGIVGIFPEGRLPREGEERPLPFKPGAAYLALVSGVPVVPLYTNGSYFRRERARVMVGVPVRPAEWVKDVADEKEKIRLVSEKLRECVMELGRKLDEQ